MITGGTSGIGLAFAEKFLEAGSNVIICGRREERLLQISDAHYNIITRVCDVAIELQRQELYTWVMQNYPETNVLINNAGVQLVADLTKPVHLERIRAEVETNFIAPVHLASLFAGHLASKPEAAIINISSGLAFVPLAFMPVYCATKAAIHSLTMSLRHQLRRTPVKVFEIAPPSVDTELGHDRRSDKSESHGGMPVAEFITEAMQAIQNDTFDTQVGLSKNLRIKGDAMFEEMNRRF